MLALRVISVYMGFELQIPQFQLILKPQERVTPQQTLIHLGEVGEMLKKIYLCQISFRANYILKAPCVLKNKSPPDIRIEIYILWGILILKAN